MMEEMEEMGEMEGAKYSLRGSSLIVTIIVTITAINAITISMGINGIIRIIYGHHHPDSSSNAGFIIILINLSNALPVHGGQVEYDGDMMEIQ